MRYKLNSSAKNTRLLLVEDETLIVLAKNIQSYGFVVKNAENPIRKVLQTNAIGVLEFNL